MAEFGFKEACRLYQSGLDVSAQDEAVLERLTAGLTQATAFDEKETAAIELAQDKLDSAGKRMKDNDVSSAVALLKEARAAEHHDEELTARIQEALIEAEGADAVQSEARKEAMEARDAALQFLDAEEVAEGAEAVMTIDMDGSKLLGPGNEKAREAFVTAFKIDMARQLGVEPDDIDVSDMIAGSLVVKFKVKGKTPGAVKVTLGGSDGGGSVALPTVAKDKTLKSAGIQVPAAVPAATIVDCVLIASSYFVRDAA
eukprot:COSAG02_NODE_12926_length_1471_cov_2.026239_2_plen_257_part_00